MATRRDVLKLSMLGGAVAITGMKEGPVLNGVSARRGADDATTSTPITTPSKLAPKNHPHTDG